MSKGFNDNPFGRNIQMGDKGQVKEEMKLKVPLRNDLYPAGLKFQSDICSRQNRPVPMIKPTKLNFDNIETDQKDHSTKLNLSQFNLAQFGQCLRKQTSVLESKKDQTPGIYFSNKKERSWRVDSLKEESENLNRKKKYSENLNRRADKMQIGESRRKNGEELGLSLADHTQIVTPLNLRHTGAKKGTVYNSWLNNDKNNSDFYGGNNTTQGLLNRITIGETNPQVFHQSNKGLI